jgi:HEAT repeat protein
MALLDPDPETRIRAVISLMQLGKNANSATGALRDAANDGDERVRKAAAAAIRFIAAEPDSLLLY